MSIWDNWRRKKPTWEIDYEFYEMDIVKRSGLSKSKLEEVVRLFKEYKILSEEG